MTSAEEFRRRVGIDSATLTLWLEEGWIAPPHADNRDVFSDLDVSRAHLIRDLGEEIGVNAEGIGVILDLLDQVHGLRTTLQILVRSVREGEKAH